MTKKRAKRMSSAARYGPFLSAGHLLGIDSPGLKDAIKVQLRPQFVGSDLKETDAVLSKRFVLVDIRNSELALNDIRGLAGFSRRLDRAAEHSPKDLLSMVTAFEHAGTKEGRLSVLNTAARLGLYNPDDSKPTALWGVLLLIGAAVLIASCCQETDTDCSDDGDTDTDGDGTGGDKPD